MALTEEQTRQLLDAAKRRGLTREQAREVLIKENQRLSSSQRVSAPALVKEKEVLSTAQRIAKPLGLGTTVENIQTLILSPFVSAANRGARKNIDNLMRQSQEISAQIRQETDPQRKQQLIEQSRQIGRQMEGVSQDIGRKTEVARQLYGVDEKDLEMEGAEFASRRGIGQTAELASFVVPQTKALQVARGTSPLSRIGISALAGSATGGLQGVAKASREAESAQDVVGDVLTGAVVGGATGAAIQGAFETPEQIRRAFQGLDKKLGISNRLEDLYISTLKENIRDKKFIKQAGGEKEVFKDAIKLRIPNTRSGVRRELVRYVDEFNDEVSRELAKSEASNKTVNLKQMYEEAKKRTLQELKDPESKDLLAQAKSYFDVADEAYLAPANEVVPLESVNRLRKRMDKQVGELLASEIRNGGAKAMKNFASNMRVAIKKELPQLKNVFRRYQLLSGLAEAMQKEPVLGITEFAFAGASPATGLGSTLFELGAGKAIRSPGLKRAFAAQGVRQLSRKSATPSISNPILRTLATQGTVQD